MKRVTALDVACPTCRRTPGQKCIRLDVDTDTPATATSPHEARRRRARDEQQRLNPAHVRGQLALIPLKEVRR